MYFHKRLSDIPITNEDAQTKFLKAQQHDNKVFCNDNNMQKSK